MSKMFTGAGRRGRIARLTRLLAAAGLLAAGCGGGQVEPAADESIPMKAGVVPAMPAAAIYLGEEKKLFDKHGVALETQPAQTGAAVVASLLNGELDVGYISTVVAVLGAAKGVPIRFAAAGDTVPTEHGRKMYGGAVVLEDSPIKSMKDLEGKTVAINALQGVDNLSTRAAVDAAGGDSSKVDFVEVAFPEQWSAVRSERVDAAIMSDPFYTQALQQGARTFGDALEALGAGAMVAGFVVTEPYAAQNKEAVSRFAKAMSESSAYANDHLDEVRQVIPSFTKISADLAGEINMPVFESELDPASIQQVIDLMVRYGYIDESIDAETLIAR